MAGPVIEGLKRVAEEEGITVTQIIKTGIMLFLTHRQYNKEGKVLYFEDKESGEKVRLEIPGLISTSFLPPKPNIKEEATMTETDLQKTI